MSTGQVQVELGEHTYTLLPQRKAYLENKLGEAFGQLENIDPGEEGSGKGLLDWLGSRTYNVLRVFIPDLMPEYEFAGYATAEAQEAGEYQEEYDKSPSVPEIVNAIEKALVVNRLDLLKHVKNFLGPDVFRASFARVMDATLPTPSSESSSIVNGASAQPSSTTPGSTAAPGSSLESSVENGAGSPQPISA